MLSLDDLQKEIGKDRAAAVATMLMAFEADRLNIENRNRERKKETETLSFISEGHLSLNLLLISGYCQPRSQSSSHTIPRGGR